MNLARRAIPFAPEAALDALIEGRFPDAHGFYGPYGGRYVPEMLVPALDRLEAGMRSAFSDTSFQRELAAELADFVGRPTPLTHARHLSAQVGADILLKREDLAHTGAHKINNALGQALLAKRMGATRVVAETGAGQHGVATAAACARVGIAATVYMGAVDMARQAPNVDRMRRMGAKVVPVHSGAATLRAAIDEAMRDWVSDPGGTFYLLGSAVGPHPYPFMVREFQKVIGTEARRQVLDRFGDLPDFAVACVGGGSNAIGLFHPFVADRGVKLVGFEAGGRGGGLGEHAATLSHGTPGVLHGCHVPLLQDEDGQVQETHSISAGLDYAAVGPEHALLQATGRATYGPVSDADALEAFGLLCELEGIIPALESSHAVAGAMDLARQHSGARILVSLSGRGDKDLPQLAEQER